MPMDWLPGGGAGTAGGLLTGLLMALGFKQRADRMQRAIDQIDKEHVPERVCAARHRAIDDALQAQKDSLRELKQDGRALRDHVDQKTDTIIGILRANGFRQPPGGGS